MVKINKFKIRKACQKDIEQLCNMFFELYNYHSKFDTEFKLKPKNECLKSIRKEMLKKIRGLRRQVVLIFEIGDKIAGFVDFAKEKRGFFLRENGIWIYNLYVDKKYRRMGIASRLVQKVAEIANRSGIKSLDFTFVPKNPESLRFWKSLKAKTLSLNAVIKTKNVLIGFLKE